ncbi:MAG: hypothetical protein M3297_04470 [Thermoproteota archaeon]|nr:hypothetical protein [Thermoproteota archaeon]
MGVFAFTTTYYGFYTVSLPASIMSPAGPVNPPVPIQNQLKREAHYGCSICGCPLLEFVQFSSSHLTGAFLPENMIAICPIHTLKFVKNELSSSELSSFKTNPYNKIKGNNHFGITSPELTVNLAKTRFINTPRLLVVDDFDLIMIRKGDASYLLLDVNFFDAQNNLIAVISENSWTTDKRQIWDIDYESRYLRIQNSSKSISFEAKVESDEIFITANMYYNGAPVNISKEQILFYGIEHGAESRGTTLKNYETAISLQSNN